MSDATATSAFSAFLDAVPDAMVVIGQDGRIQFINEQTLSLFGYGRDQLLGQTVEVLVPERFRATHAGKRSGYFGDPRKRPMGRGTELFGRRSDGTEFPAEISLGPVETADGTLVMAAVRDVTEPRRAQQALHETEARLREAELRAAQQELARQQDVLERFFALSPDMMCIAGVDGSFKRVSPAFEALGYSNEELLTRSFLDFVHPDDKAATLAEIQKLATGVPMINFENRYRRKDGSYRWLSWGSAPDSSGTVYATARDVTDSKRVQGELVRATEMAMAANQELESFSYSVAHDLRAPLRSIDGFSQALLEDCNDQLDESGRKYLRFVRESAQRMAQLIDAMLMLSRVTRSGLERETVDLSALARAAYERLDRSAPGRSVEVVIQEGLVGDGDPRLLAAVFDNLFGNAWKFTRNREEARIEFGATSKDGRRAYFVRDNGAGFDMTYASKLFGVFQRLHAAHEFEGTGVGLATVQRIVHRHGGRIWGEGKVEAGATFYFTLGARE